MLDMTAYYQLKDTCGVTLNFSSKMSLFKEWDVWDGRRMDMGAGKYIS